VFPHSARFVTQPCLLSGAFLCLKRPPFFLLCFRAGVELQHATCSPLAHSVFGFGLFILLVFYHSSVCDSIPAFFVSRFLVVLKRPPFFCLFSSWRRASKLATCPPLAHSVFGFGLFNPACFPTRSVFVTHSRPFVSAFLVVLRDRPSFCFVSELRRDSNTATLSSPLRKSSVRIWGLFILLVFPTRSVCDSFPPFVKPLSCGLKRPPFLFCFVPELA